jgi:MbtH protein
MHILDDPDGVFVVLVNERGEHSLWPAGAEVPAGWTVSYEAASRNDALAYVERNWTALNTARPASPARSA